ncbi:hypothetical protein [Leptothrix discophora]|uniref:Uncharacterized protein n=1 Tax=Leptothrix discophora TaxID=89 RepID=A0ABT9G0E6_LEPDI|nr:hypothetical protein [Leptothrix discophora]MDP4299960.1 hypothetical protein [Leptothrix discophora]
MKPLALTLLPRRLLPRRLLAVALISTLAWTAPARAQRDAVVDASAASSAALSLPVAAVASTGFVVLGGAAVLTVVAVQASATGTVWVLERASDGARVVLRFSGRLARGAAVGAGTALSVTTVAAGTLLSASGELLCFVPRPEASALMHDQRLTF